MPPTEGTLESALALAAEQHEGQTDKAGRPYILHVLAVVRGVEDLRLDRPNLLTEEQWGQALVTAALHDVVEDTNVTLKDLLYTERYEDTVVYAVNAMTRRAGEPYQWEHGVGDPNGTYLRRVLDNPIACAVKWADLRHNSNPLRLATLSESDRARLFDRYQTAAFRIRDRWVAEGVW